MKEIEVTHFELLLGHRHDSLSLHIVAFEELGVTIQVCHCHPLHNLCTRPVFDGLNVKEKYSIRDVHTPQPGEIVFNSMRDRSSETVQRSGSF